MVYKQTECDQFFFHQETAVIVLRSVAYSPLMQPENFTPYLTDVFLLRLIVIKGGHYDPLENLL